jgi:stress response protein YsnF
MNEPDPNDRDIVVPVVQEEVRADAVPVVTGGVRVTKHVETQDELIEQQLRTSRAEVKRVKTNRVVDGPQPTRREGSTLIIPVVSEVIRVHKEWVVTEEIHVLQREDVETVQKTVPVNYERAEIERLNESGNAEPLEAEPVEKVASETAGTPRSIIARRQPATSATSRKPLSGRNSLFKDR